jgi:outer membrane protein OmpA-like peptidoglycan-associated protein
MLRLIAFAASFALMSAGAYAQAPLNKDELIQKLKPAPLTRSLTGDRAPTRQIVVEKGNEAAIIEAKKDLPKVNIKIQFEFNSAILTPEGRGALKVLADALKDPALQGQKFLVGGHTDAVGTAVYNQGLSDARARSVAEHLAVTYQISPERLKTIGFGFRELADPARPDSGENRRVEIVTLPN